MQVIRYGDTGAAVEDVQQRLVATQTLAPECVNGLFDQATLEALHTFCAQSSLEQSDVIDDAIWSALVDASYHLGDRSLFLKMPYFHGNDVREIQQALGALGFACGKTDGIFGAHTEAALRKFQLNMALDSDGIAGANTYRTLRNLHHSWEGKPSFSMPASLSFARVADVLERHALCFFGTDEFSRSVASRISNLALATNPSSHVVSAESLLVEPDDRMLLVRIVLSDSPLAKQARLRDASALNASYEPVVFYDDAKNLSRRLGNAFEAANKAKERRIVVVLPSVSWNEAGPERSAQHYAIELLDAVCTVLADIEE